IYDRVNNGVYRAGFATSQQAYEQAFEALFETLDELEQRLATRRYLLGDTLTEADWRLFTTLIRFAAVYHGHFKCNLQRMKEHPSPSGYLRELDPWPGLTGTLNLQHIKQLCRRSHTTVNPTGMVPAAPRLELDRPHGRDRL